jgi:hypothetical protein
LFDIGDKDVVWMEFVTERRVDQQPTTRFPKTHFLENPNFQRSVSMNKRSKLLYPIVSTFLVLAAQANSFATQFDVTNTNNDGAGSLRQAILDANASGSPGGIVTSSNTINISASGTLLLGDALPLIFSNLNVNGNDLIIDGGRSHRCVFVSGLPTQVNPLVYFAPPQPISVVLSRLTFRNCVAHGGNGGGGGGGGLGAGGALFVGPEATVSLNAVSFDQNAAIGGSGGTGTFGGGGGGLGGNGGEGAAAGGGGIGADGGDSGPMGGGGGGGIGGRGGSNGGGGGGFGGTGIGQIAPNQGFGRAGSGFVTAGGANGGGGSSDPTTGAAGDGSGSGADGSMANNSGGGGGWMGGNAQPGYPFRAGAGGIGGGGGNGPVFGYSSASGGFGGGAGGNGIGGFGGGGGAGGGYPYQFGSGGGGAGIDPRSGGQAYSPGPGGYGGGGGSANGQAYQPGYSSSYGGTGGVNGGGGGGAALGGAVFVCEDGVLNIAGTGSMSGSAVSPGSGGGYGATDGAAVSRGIFFAGGGSLAVTVGSGEVYSFVDETTGPWDLSVSGGGKLVIADQSKFPFDANVTGATLEVNGALKNQNTNLHSSGVLRGTGSANVVYVFDGTIEPGSDTNPYGALSVAEYDAQNDASRLVVATNLINAAQLSVAGNATLAGVARIEFAATPAVGASVPLLTAGGSISGNFVDWHTNMSEVFGVLTYSANEVTFDVLATDDIFHSSFTFSP